MVTALPQEKERYTSAGLYGPGDRAKVAVLDDCTVDLSAVFTE